MVFALFCANRCTTGCTKKTDITFDAGLFLILNKDQTRI